MQMTNTIFDRPDPHDVAAPPGYIDAELERYKLFSLSEEKFKLKMRYLLWIGDHEDLDYDHEREAKERLQHLLRTGLPQEALAIKTYWYISAGSDEDYLIARHYMDYSEAEEALSRAKMRWFNQHMDDQTDLSIMCRVKI
jgi:hypothetical protein